MGGVADFKLSSFDNDELAWIWSYRQQLELLDQFDAIGLKCARGRWTQNTWSEFLTRYNLRRGSHSLVSSHDDVRIVTVQSLFLQPLKDNDPVKELNARWEEGVAELKASRHGKTLRVSLWSMTSKLLWFYQPSTMTMFDQFASKGLRIARNERARRGLKQLRPIEYLPCFEDYFENNRDKIAFAAGFSDRTYPYPRRVADKRLWLLGNANSERILDAFRESLRIAPIDR